MTDTPHNAHPAGDPVATVLQDIVSREGLSYPDGRALCNYDLPSEDFSRLEKSLNLHIARTGSIEAIAHAFVFWAAEHIRTRFEGGPLTWGFIFNGIEFDEEQNLGRRLVGNGLKWWRIQVRKSELGRHMFLYSLMAEGGLPEALLKNEGRYRQILTGFVSEIETEWGGISAAPLEGIARRWISKLPDVFSTDDFARLLTELAQSLICLRSKLPNDLPESAARRWLDRHDPGWASTLPMRMTKAVAESLIRPVLEAERGGSPIVSKPLSMRELRRGDGGIWIGYLTLSPDGWLQSGVYPGAEGLRLRLSAVTETGSEAVLYGAIPEGQDWRVTRLGSNKAASFGFPLSEAFTLAAFADGRAKGEAVIEPALPHPSESPSLWRAVDSSDDGLSADRLTLLSGAGRTRASCLWLLVPENTHPEVDSGLTVDGPEPGPEGRLWRVSGRGVLRVRERRYRIETGADGDSADARLVVEGEILPRWRLDDRNPVYRGDVTFYRQNGASHLLSVPERKLRRKRSRRVLGGEVVELMDGDVSLAAAPVIRLPGDVALDVRETGPGRVELNAGGLPDGWVAILHADEQRADGEVSNGAVSLTVECSAEPPSSVRLRLYDAPSGLAMQLKTAWPARRGTILRPSGARLARNQRISVDCLRGWRAVVPEEAKGSLQLQFVGHPAVWLPVAGDVALTPYLPLARAMLAQGDPDAQVNLSLLVDGFESLRLEIRRYPDDARVVDDAPSEADWRHLVSVPHDPEWDSLLHSIRNTDRIDDSGAFDRVRAVASAPTAVVFLAMRSPAEDLADILALDTVAPILWPSLPVADFFNAVRAAHDWKFRVCSRYFDEDESSDMAAKSVATRINKILVHRPELRAHFAKAIVDAGLLDRFVRLHDDHRQILAPPNIAMLVDLAQQAARRFDRLPDGVGRLQPENRRDGLAGFGKFTQPMIDAPLVAAEMAAGRRPQPSVADKLLLINLRLVDPVYFDAALPVALDIYMNEHAS